LAAAGAIPSPETSKPAAIHPGSAAGSNLSHEHSSVSPQQPYYSGGPENAVEVVIGKKFDSASQACYNKSITRLEVSPWKRR
jgi:hypothetical protein